MGVVHKIALIQILIELVESRRTRNQSRCSCIVFMSMIT